MSFSPQTVEVIGFTIGAIFAIFVLWHLSKIFFKITLKYFAQKITRDEVFKVSKVEVIKRKDLTSVVYQYKAASEYRMITFQSTICHEPGTWVKLEVFCCGDGIESSDTSLRILREEQAP